MMMRETPGDATLSKIKQELESIYASKKNDKGSVSSLLYWFETTGQKQRADEIRAVAIASNPRGENCLCRRSTPDVHRAGPREAVRAAAKAQYGFS
jgi:hypothetical protein